MNFNNKALSDAALSRRISALTTSKARGVGSNIPADRAVEVIKRNAKELGEAIAERNVRPNYRQAFKGLSGGLLSPAGLAESVAAGAVSNAKQIQFKKDYMDEENPSPKRMTKPGRTKA